MKCRRPEEVVDDQGDRCSEPPKGRKEGHLVQVLHHDVEPLGPESAPEVNRGDERKRVSAADAMHFNTVERSATATPRPRRA